MITVCLPFTNAQLDHLPYWDDQRTGAQIRAARVSTAGIFTSVSGTAPNRIFNIEWRTSLFHKHQPAANDELKLDRGAEPLRRADLRHGGSGQRQRHSGRAEKATPPLTSISATAQAVRLAAGKATHPANLRTGAE